jgi:hypothetical protein
MDWNLWILKWSGSDPMTCVIEKEEVVELLKKLGHRIIDVEDRYSSAAGNIIIITGGESHESISYRLEGCD